jgi:hypothetical protein
VTVTEILRRIRALSEMHPRERPIPLERVAQLAGMDDSQLLTMLRGKGGMHERTRIRLSRAFEWVENDQVVIGKMQGKRGGGGTPASVTIRPPQPPQVTVRRVRFTTFGPKIEFVALNPRKFEKIPNT